MNFLGNFKKSCHFELSLENEKSIRILKYALNFIDTSLRSVWQASMANSQKKKEKRKVKKREKREKRENEKMKKWKMCER